MKNRKIREQIKIVLLIFDSVEYCLYVYEIMKYIMSKYMLSKTKMHLYKYYFKIYYVSDANNELFLFLCYA